jgi:hypothetical protein
MPDINSPLGRRAFAATSQRVLTVPDENSSNISNFVPQVREKPQEFAEQDIEAIQAARKAKLLAAKKISPTAKERIEILTELGRCYDEVEFEGVNFSIQSLKGKEIRAVVRISNSAVNAADSYFEARDQTLARSIYKIDGQPIDIVLGTEKLEDIVSWVGELDESLLEYLHNRYLKMMRENKNKFIIKDEQDAKEVAEEIKK